MPQIIASSVVCVLLVAYIIYAFIVPPEWARRDPVQVQGPSAAELFEPLPLNATFTTAGRIKFEDLTLSFRYPNFWEYGELHSDQVDATVRVIRPGNDPVHAGITLLVTSCTRMSSGSLLYTDEPFVGCCVSRKSGTATLSRAAQSP